MQHKRHLHDDATENKYDLRLPSSSLSKMPQENRKTLVKMSLFQDNVVCQVADLKKSESVFSSLAVGPSRYARENESTGGYATNFPDFFQFLTFDD